MPAKKLWLTYLPGKSDLQRLNALMEQLTRYGLTVDGGFWDGNLEKLGWASHLEPLKDPSRAQAWLIAGTKENWEDQDIQYGLSCLYLSLGMERAESLPGFALVFSGKLSEDRLPTALKSLEVFSDDDPAWPAKLLASVHRAGVLVSRPYRIALHANEYLGQWIEVGPSDKQWSGAMLGIDQGEITHHGVGPSGFPPERCVLEYPWRGLKLEVGGIEYTAWAVQNELGPQDSYYVKFTGHPASIVFGDNPEIGSGEAFVFRMKA